MSQIGTNRFHNCEGIVIPSQTCDGIIIPSQFCDRFVTDIIKKKFIFVFKFLLDTISKYYNILNNLEF